MKKIKLNVDVEFSDDEMRAYLTNNGYRIEEHECVVGAYSFGPNSHHQSKGKRELALSDTNSEIDSKNEYRTVFENLIKDSFSKTWKKFILG